MPTKSLASLIPPDDDDSDGPTTAQSPASAPTATPATEAPVPAAEPDTTTQGATKPAEKKGGRAATAPASRTSTRGTGAGATPSSTAAKRGKPAASAGEQPAGEQPASGPRPGRPRVPKPGPTTRVTVDLAATEQAALEKLTGTIGRQIGRAQGKQKIYVQHLMRVATRRLLSDDAFRQAVADDLAEHRDELKRQK